MVRELSFRKSIQNLKDPSFFLTSTTGLAHGLTDFHIAPILTSLLGAYGLHRIPEVESSVSVLKGYIVVEFYLMFDF